MSEIEAFEEWQWQGGSGWVGENVTVAGWASGSGRVAVFGSVGKSAKK
jgi:hypothetical protein